MTDANETIGHWPEILEKVLSSCNVKTLSRAATVCRLWNELATREMRKRGPQTIVMPVSDVYNFMETKPLVTFFFVSSFHWRDNDLITCQNSFPNHSMIVTGEHVMIDEEEIFYRDFLSQFGIVALLIPQYRDLKIQTAYDNDSLTTKWCYDDDNNYADTLAQAFLNDFLPDDSHSKATFIIFGPGKYSSSRLVNLLDKRMKERRQEYVLWGADFYKSPFIPSDPTYECDSDSRGIFAMSITGSSLESSSIVIDHRIAKSEFDQKLLDFKNQVKFKRRSIGLLCGPKLYNTKLYYSREELMKTVKRIFPHTSFIGVHKHLCCYGLKSQSDDPKQRLMHLESFSFIILTFD